MTSANAIPVSERDGNDLGALTSMTNNLLCQLLHQIDVYCVLSSAEKNKEQDSVDDGLQMLDEG